MENKINVSCMDLAEITEKGYRTVLNLLKDIILELETRQKTGDKAIENAVSALKDIVDKSTERNIFLALLGEMSSGKTSLINAALGYPLFPVAKVTTSACPVEIRYGEKFELQVFSVEKNKETVFYTYNDAGVLTEDNKNKLLAYSQKCVNDGILVCENFDYYFDIIEGSADLNNTLHCAQLLIALLNGHIGQDFEGISDRRKALVEERKKLLRDILGDSADKSFALRVYIDSEILRHGITLIDLPGLGSDTKTHTDITTNYINKADCCVMLFGLDGRTSSNSSALELMQKYEIMRYSGKSNRFISAINKCDGPYEINRRHYGSLIRQAANSVYATLHSVDIRDIVPISARYAEYRYVLYGGVEPENTLLGMQLYDKSKEEITAELKRRYDTAFEYVDPKTDTKISYSTRDFFEEVIGEYILRIRFLNLAKNISEVVKCFQETLDGLQVETKLIAMLELLGGSLMENLMSRMSKALQNTKESFLKSVGNIKDEMEKSRSELSAKLDNEVIPAYEKEISEADKHLNTYMDQRVAKMLSDWAGHYCIDGLDDKSKINKGIFDDMKAYFSSFDFNPYLKSGNNLLEKYFNDQRESYKKGVNMLNGCFRELSGKVGEVLDTVFEEFLTNEKIEKEKSPSEDGDEGLTGEIINIYRKCFNDTKLTIIDSLSHLSENMAKEILSDTLVEDEIQESISVTFSYFNDLIDWYHTSCGKYLDLSKGVTIMLGRPYLDVSEIRRHISKPFLTEDNRKDYVGGLKSVLIGQDEKSHNSRMERALNKTFTVFKAEASRRIKRVIPVVNEDIKFSFDSGAGKIRYRYAHILEAMRLLYDNLCKVETNSAIEFVLDNEFDWAKDSTVIHKENLTDTRTLFEESMEKIEIQIRTKDKTTSDDDTCVVETETL